MTPRTLRRRTAACVAALAACAALTATQAQAQPQATPTQNALTPATKFYVDPHSKAAKQAVVDFKNGDFENAKNMARMASWPQAEWFTEGTPGQVRGKVSKLVHRARAVGRTPVLVAYNVPGRDCTQYSSGGAASSAAYRKWIDAFAAGIGTNKAVVVVEPDGTALLPNDCGPDVDPTGALTAERTADLAYAVKTLKAKPRTTVYLDAGNVQWRPVGDMAQRLLDSGVQHGDGFALNVSNTHPTDHNARYGTWIAKCMWYATEGPEEARGHAERCAGQHYSPAAPNDGTPGNAVNSNDPATWRWTDLWFDENVGSPSADRLKHFVIDTSRNGLGAWVPEPGKYTGDPEPWCNAPGRGLGPRPTANTGVPLVDAYLWIKIPGESDGSCTRNTGGTIDPEYGIVDPPAGTWWPEQAHTLARNAAPRLTFNR
ncbi:glycoside hydrolase family 6 protein [Streptomyces sp. TRM68416]|uniref:glycoside hydrolase family 6 protein n=1 Tax=Streptomyces sp. TRM68416 TaxID=2758412 RepID=UPI0016620E1F|nr:glycoside hydrolase family 6 protein [Streptomyces sp. TRM68416]MBD0839933.1 glycoside hydrolase family 6 protein [Streptomyces sp. TRM68416]